MSKSRWTPLVLSLVLFLPLLAHAGSETYSFTFSPTSGFTGDFTYISASGFLSYPMPAALSVTTSSDIIFGGLDLARHRRFSFLRLAARFSL